MIMPLVSLKSLLDVAAEYDFGLPAFNVNNLEQVQAILEAAHEVNAPVILQASAGARKYAGTDFLSGLLHTAVAAYPHLPICLHQDHGASLKVCQEAINMGFSSVMMDGSLQEDMKTPSSYEYNVEVTRQVVELASQYGVSVEGELGCLGSLETLTADKEDGSGAEGVLDRNQLLTSVDQAIDFVKKTNIDALAIAIGTSHGVAKFKKPPTDDVLALDRLKELHLALPNTHFVMHGSSSVPQDLLDEINLYGGALSQTYGVPLDAIQKAIKMGVRKINIDTDLRLATTGTIRKFFQNKPTCYDPREYLGAARNAMKKICIERYLAFGAEGKASKVKKFFKIDRKIILNSPSLKPFQIAVEL
jgi:fructose-bisphosphate aldolase, class II